MTLSQKSFLARIGTAAVLVVILCQPSQLHAEEEVQFSSEKIMGHVGTLADKSLLGRRAGTPFERRAAEYVSQQLDALSVPPLPSGERLQHFRLSPDKAEPTSVNVLGWIAPPQAAEAEGVVVLAAHIDHVGETDNGGYYPGANDNASGVAVVLEVAHALKLRCRDLRRPVVIAFFGAEEVGLVGSRRFVSEGPIDRSTIVAMVNVDMIGRPLVDQSQFALLKRVLKIDSNNSVGVVGTQGRPFFVQTVEDACRRAKISVYGTQPVLSPIATSLARNRADHSPFEDMGVPTLFFGSGESDDYHQPTDTIDKLVPELMARRAIVVFETVLTLATVERERIPARKQREVVPAKKAGQ